MPYQVLFQRLSFQRTDPSNPVVPVGNPEVVVRGDLVPDYVPLFQISALESAGMIAAVADADPRVFPSDMLPAQSRNPEQPPVLPSDPNGTPPLLGDLPTGEPVSPDRPVVPVVREPDPVTEPLPPLPASADKKEVWEAYAQRPQIGMTAGEAEAMTKANLIAEVSQRAQAK